MSKEVTLRDQQATGSRSEVALAELGAAIGALEKDCFEAFKASEIHDDEGRKTCRIYHRVLSDVHERFKHAIITGEAARRELIVLSEPDKIRKMSHV